MISIDLAGRDDILAKIDLHRDVNQVAVAQVTFESANARRAWAACLRALSDVLVAAARCAEIPGQIRSFPLDLRDPVVGPLTYVAGDAWLELAGLDAWLILAAAFGEPYVEVLSQMIQPDVISEPTSMITQRDRRQDEPGAVKLRVIDALQRPDVLDGSKWLVLPIPVLGTDLTTTDHDLPTMTVGVDPARCQAYYCDGVVGSSCFGAKAAFTLDRLLGECRLVGAKRGPDV